MTVGAAFTTAAPSVAILREVVRSRAACLIRKFGSCSSNRKCACIVPHCRLIGPGGFTAAFFEDLLFFVLFLAIALSIPFLLAISRRLSLCVFDWGERALPPTVKFM